ncbi:MAG TPA: flavodoxin family protein [Methanocorpusculum sp.]|nr:flavodoxin family protein [Methanocorpusculum sp.]
MADVVLISGSPRADGNTEQCMNICREEIEKAGLTAKVITLCGKKINSCAACNYCAETGRCAIDDDLNDMLDDIKSADGFIIGSPVYFGTARGDVMNLLQRVGKIARGSGNWLSGKIGGPVAVARRGGQTSALQEMLMVFFISGMTVVGSTYWNMVFAHDKGEAENDTEGVETLKTFARNTANMIIQMRK